MKKMYLISGVVLSVVTLIAMIILMWNEDASVRILCAVAFPVIAFLLSFPTGLISRKILATGDQIQSKGWRILYYVALPVVSVLVFYGLAWVLYLISTAFDKTNPEGDFAYVLGQALIYVFLEMVLFIVVLLPTLQTYIVMILRKLMKVEDSSMNSLQ